MRQLLVLVIVCGSLSVPSLPRACEAMMGAEYRDPPEMIALALDSDWQVGLRGRSTTYARKEFIRKGATLSSWEEMVTWYVSFGSVFDLPRIHEDLLQKLASLCPGLESSLIRQTETEIVFEWSNKGCAERADQYQVTRLVAAETGQHTLTYSVRGAALAARAPADRERWVAFIRDAPLTWREPMSEPRSAVDRAMIKIWRRQYGEAFAALEPMAKAGDPAAEEALAGMYFEGWGVPRDYARALDWMERAAVKKRPRAIYQLGVMYEQGFGVDPNADLALRRYREAARLGDGDAQGRLGYLLSQGGAADSNYAEAAKWFAQAAQSGHSHALYWLGRLHQDGLGVKRDLGAAARLYERAAEAGEPDAQMRLGMAYADGLGVPMDAARAKVWLTRAVMQGQEEARAFFIERYRSATEPNDSES